MGSQHLRLAVPSPTAFALALSFTLVCVTLAAPPPAPAQSLAPRLVLEGTATGVVMHEPGAPPETVTVAITDSSCGSSFAVPPRVTLPRHSRVTFTWRFEAGRPGAYPIGYHYKLDEAQFVAVDPSVDSVAYDLTRPGRYLFTLRVTDNYGQTGEATRCFRLGSPPDTWIAGPDLALLDARFGWSGTDRHLGIADWNALPDLSGTPLSCDSLTLRPAERARHKTFFEIYRNHLYVRSENDTVHLNSWVIVPLGGSDPDSPYDVMVSPLDPALGDSLPCGVEHRVLRPAGVVGSPVAFRSKVVTRLDPAGPVNITSFGNSFPNFDPLSNFRNPVVLSYAPMIFSGKAYYHARAVDGDGNEDESVGSAQQIADHVDAGIGTPEEIALRPRILTFYVNQPPYLRYQTGGFAPVPHQVFPERSLWLNLLAYDDDPSNPTLVHPIGGPSSPMMLRWNVRLEGLDSEGGLVSVSPLPGPVFDPRIHVTVPDQIVGPDVTVRVELCDCDRCEDVAGIGRCADVAIPIRVPATITPALGSLIAASARPDGVSLRWRLPDAGVARVERRTAATEWRALGDTRVNAAGEAVYEDAAVAPGTRYGYRVAFTSDGAEAIAGETWIDVPSRFELALEGLRPNPARGSDLAISFSLPTSRGGRLELVDVAGRRWVDRDLTALGAGRHVIRLGAGARVPPGVYLIRLTQGEHMRVTRGAVLE